MLSFYKNSIFICVFLFLSCNGRDFEKPETVLGIRLGEPCVSQIDSLIKVGKIKTDGNFKYVDYGTVKGVLSILNFDMSDKESDLKALVIHFTDPTLNREFDDKTYLTEDELNYMKSMFQDKYGEPSILPDNLDGTDYIWQKKNLVIKLWVREPSKLESKKYYEVESWYSFPEEIEKKLEEKYQKLNKKI